MSKPNVLVLMCDQFRFDCIAALGNAEVKTPNLDRLVRRGVSFDNAYSDCPVCVAARYTLRTGCRPPTTGCYSNEVPAPMDGLPQDIHARCGEYLATAMGKAGYRTFGIGKFHTTLAFNEPLGFEVQLNTEELWETPEEVEQDAYASFIRRNHPEYAHIEQLHGERANMYYVPQVSPLPAQLTVEAYVADQAVQQLQTADSRPYFGFVSFIGPHPPFAPPVPYNRMYDPDRMPGPRSGNREIDHMDGWIPFMNHLMYADDINDAGVRQLRARYYGEISYIDDCIGRILDAVEARGDGENTLILFTADHGDHLGDHHAWQKESWFEAACRVPFLLSWPARLPAGGRSSQLAALADVFGLCTTAAGVPQLREGHDILGVLAGSAPPRESLFACYGRPDGELFKLMVRQGPWKYIYIKNGGREQLFNLEEDPGETKLYNATHPQVLAQLRAQATGACGRAGLRAALAQGQLAALPAFEMPKLRAKQFNHALGVCDFSVQ